MNVTVANDDNTLGMVASFVWNTLSETNGLYELMVALLFIVGWGIGTFRARGQKPTLYKVATKHKGAAWRGGAANKAQPGRGRMGATKPRVARFDGHIEDVDLVLLTKPSWVVPQVVRLCDSQVTQALELYRAAMRAGLQLQEMPAGECRNLFMQMVTAAIRDDQAHEVQKLFKDLVRSGLRVDLSLIVSTVKLCTCRQLFADCLAIFDFISKDPKVAVDPSLAFQDKAVWSCLLFCATQEKAYDKCTYFFKRLKDCGTPQAKDFGNMLRLAASKGDWETSLSIIQDMAKSDVEIDSVQYNTALATLGVAGRVHEARTLLDLMETKGSSADVISYNTVMKGYATGGRMDECFEMFVRLQAKGMSPSQVTYGILLDGFINGNQVDRAVQIFDDMKKSGCPLNTVLCTLLIKGFARAGDCDQAMHVYSQMKAENEISPDIVTFSILIKAHCDNDRLEEAFIILGELVTSGLKPDEVVFNSLIGGCAKQGNVKLGKQLLADMIASGVRPSNATFSILIRLYHQSKCLEEAVALLKTEPAKHNVQPEARLYLQLIQSCIRERQGRRAIEVYNMLSEWHVPTPLTHSSVLATCIKLHMYDTGAEIVRIAVANGASVTPRDTQLLLEGAFKKGKHQVVQSCVDSMQTLGHNVDAKFLS